MSATPASAARWSESEAIAGDARLRDLEQGAADLKAIADANGIVRQSFDR
jgi:hypothetical protein